MTDENVDLTTWRRAMVLRTGEKGLFPMPGPTATIVRRRIPHPCNRIRSPPTISRSAQLPLVLSLLPLLLDRGRFRSFIVRSSLIPHPSAALLLRGDGLHEWRQDARQAAARTCRRHRRLGLRISDPRAAPMGKKGRCGSADGGDTSCRAIQRPSIRHEPQLCLTGQNKGPGRLSRGHILGQASQTISVPLPPVRPARINRQAHHRSRVGSMALFFSSSPPLRTARRRCPARWGKAAGGGGRCERTPNLSAPKRRWRGRR
ncbi:unnamed protein product [Phaeothamnion confervicola]